MSRLAELFSLNDCIELPNILDWNLDFLQRINGLIVTHVSSQRHTSKFKENVKNEEKFSKAPNKTMGPAKVQTRPPEDFLKKGEGEVKRPESKKPACHFTGIFFFRFFFFFFFFYF